MREYQYFKNVYISLHKSVGEKRDNVRKSEPAPAEKQSKPCWKTAGGCNFKNSVKASKPSWKGLLPISADQYSFPVVSNTLSPSSSVTLKTPMALIIGKFRLATHTTVRLSSHSWYHIPTYLLSPELPVGLKNPISNFPPAETRVSPLSIIHSPGLIVSLASQYA